MEQDDNTTNEIKVETNDPIQKEQSRKTKWKIRYNNWQKFFQLTANLVITVGILISIATFLSNKAQADSSKKLDKMKNTLELIFKIYDNDFINKYATIIALDSLENNEQIEDFNILFNNYYIISVIYNSNNADEAIITKTIGEGVKTFTESSVYKHTIKKYSNGSIDEIKKMIDNMYNKKDSIENKKDDR